MELPEVETPTHPSNSGPRRSSFQDSDAHRHCSPLSVDDSLTIVFCQYLLSCSWLLIYASDVPAGLELLEAGNSVW